MTRHGLGGSMTLKNYPSRGSMIVKTGGSMFLKKTPLQGLLSADLRSVSGEFKFRVF
jgi:hypothetical protein